jgi:hypothetical protein
LYIRRALEELSAEEALAQRMDELEAMEMWAEAEGDAPEWHGWRSRGGTASSSRGQPRFASQLPPPGRGRRRAWGSTTTLAEAVMGMFSAVPFAGAPPPSFAGCQSCFLKLLLG